MDRQTVPLYKQLSDDRQERDRNGNKKNQNMEANIREKCDTKKIIKGKGEISPRVHIRMEQNRIKNAFWRSRRILRGELIRSKNNQAQKTHTKRKKNEKKPRIILVEWVLLSHVMSPFSTTHKFKELLASHPINFHTSISIHPLEKKKRNAPRYEF